MSLTTSPDCTWQTSSHSFIMLFGFPNVRMIWTLSGTFQTSRACGRRGLGMSHCLAHSNHATRRTHQCQWPELFIFTFGSFKRLWNHSPHISPHTPSHGHETVIQMCDWVWWLKCANVDLKWQMNYQCSVVVVWCQVTTAHFHRQFSGWDPLGPLGHFLYFL